MSTTTVTYLGGPTALLEWGGLRIVTDPTFDAPQRYDDPDESTLTKTAGPAIPRRDIEPVDLVLLSHHGHKDNLDWEGLELIAQGPMTLSTQLAASELWGGSVLGFDDWEQQTIGDATVTIVPALHGPPGSLPFVGPVVGFVLEKPGEPTVYVSGDNASLALVEQIAGRFPAIDVALLFAGAARVPGLDAALTLTSEDAARAAELLGAPQIVGLHVEDWEHFSENRTDLESAFERAGIGDRLVPTPRGERVEL
ncbi:MBL fold metallo-hydrolase [Lysinimonas soli]|uniref:MBL fold metallo-hydrolase n=1 Tax=Lysinimonas soli TaxID=1074233 RepID=A0ABW0NLK4_9MICO